jgi:hypothetical protein
MFLTSLAIYGARDDAVHVCAEWLCVLVGAYLIYYVRSHVQFKVIVVAKPSFLRRRSNEWCFERVSKLIKKQGNLVE